MKRSHYHMTVGKETGWCHSGSDSGYRSAQKQVLVSSEQNAKAGD